MTGAGAEGELPSWHDNLIYRLQFDAGDSAAGDWRSDLVLDIDHIVAWIRGNDGRAMFRVAPARLVFHSVTDLRLAIDFTGDECPRNLAELSIADISRQAAAPRGATLHAPTTAGASGSICRRERSPSVPRVSRRQCSQTRCLFRNRGWRRNRDAAGSDPAGGA